MKSFLAVFKDPRLIRWYAVIAVNMFFVSILFGFLPVRVYALQYGAFNTGLLLSLVALVTCLSSRLQATWPIKPISQQQFASGYSSQQ